ncbi:site-specific DNA-methyltransferase [Brevibacillus laterosporus]|uniref:DNA-methyltransferase n=1 Tax=Brevibacillus laterosporus TaxID=1465 RepID=UPI0035A62E27
MGKEKLASLEINRIYHMDCLEGMKLIPDKSIDMILCDLPYGTTKCKWDTIIPFESLWEQYRRIIKKDGVIALTGSQPFTSELIHSNLEWFREHLVWVKHKPSNFARGKYMHLRYHEDIVIFCNGKPTYTPQMQERKSERVKQMQKGKSKKWNTVRQDGEEVSCRTLFQPKEWTEYNADKKYPSTILEIPAVNSNSKEKTKHPTQKPVALFEYLIRTYTNGGDVVLDNCIGSGTTAEAALNTKRRFLGFETESKYIEIANQRIENTYCKIADQKLLNTTQ